MCMPYYLQPLNMEQYDSVRNMASELHAYAPDARVLTTYYSGMYNNALLHVSLLLFYCFFNFFLIFLNHNLNSCYYGTSIADCGHWT